MWTSKINFNKRILYVQEFLWENHKNIALQVFYICILHLHLHMRN